MEAEFCLTPQVQDWQWQIADTMRRGIETSFGCRPDEVDCVQAIVEAVAGTPPVTGQGRSGDAFRLEVESAFLHGHRSQVSFRVGGATYQRELADLLVIATFVQDGALSFQRACFIQAKRSATPSGSSAARFGIDTWQLALLGSFPELMGITGVLKGQTVHLRNRSGMLGAYGLLSPPGEFTVVSARILSQVLGGRKSLPAKELVPAILSEVAASRNSSPTRSDHLWLDRFDPENCLSCREIACYFPEFLHHLWCHRQAHVGQHAPVVNTPAASILTCAGLDEFVQSWTGLLLGEVWHAGNPTDSDRTLRRCVSRIVSRVAAQAGTLQRVDRLLREAGGGGDDPIPHDTADWGPAGLGVLSVIATSSRGQEMER